MRHSRVIVLTDFFRPARSAGGIVASLENLFLETEKAFRFLVITRNRDLTSKLLSCKNDMWYKQKSQSEIYYPFYIQLQSFIEYKKIKGFLPSFFLSKSNYFAFNYFEIRCLFSRKKNYLLQFVQVASF